MNSAATPVPWNEGQWPGIDPAWIFKGCKLTLNCGSNDEMKGDTKDQSKPPATTQSEMSTKTTPMPATRPGKGWPGKQNKGKSWIPPPKSWKPPKWKQPTPPPIMNPIMTMKPPRPPYVNWKKPTPLPNMWKQPPTTKMWTETTPGLPKMMWKPPPPPIKWKKGPRPMKSWKPPPPKSWRPPPPKSWRPPKMPIKTWPPAIATPQPDMWATTKPDCKNTPTTVTTPSPQPPTQGDLMEPPQIIIISKLPKELSPGPKHNKDNLKGKLPPGPWTFPPIKYNPKTSKNRKDKNIPIGNYKRQPNPPSISPYPIKGWPMDVLPPKFTWPSNAMRRWTTKNPSQFSAWKYKYPKKRTWKEMLKKWMGGL